MHPGTKLCQIKCANGEEYTLYGLVEGSLIEINERVIQDPQILLSNVKKITLDILFLPSYFFNNHSRSQRGTSLSLTQVCTSIAYLASLVTEADYRRLYSTTL